MMEYYTGKCLFNVVDGNGKFTTRTRRIATLGGDRWAKEYHVWTMDWTPDKIDLSLDGTLMNHFPLELADKTGPNGTNPYRNPGTKKMVLNQALGGSCGGEFRAPTVRLNSVSTGSASTPGATSRPARSRSTAAWEADPT